MSNRRHTPHLAGGVNLGLIVTPMLDMSFQILSFFIMTYHPSALEGHIAGSLAPPKIIAQKSKDNNQVDIIPQSVNPDDILPEIQEAPTVIVKVGGEPGAPSKIYLQRDKAQTDAAEVADASTSNWKQAKQDLARELKRVKKEATDQSNIKMEADGDLQQKYVLEVYDICKQSGFPKIHFVPPPQLRKTEK